MVSVTPSGTTALERLQNRFETTETECGECGYVDVDGNWTSRMADRRIVYRHACPTCDATREYAIRLDA